MNDGSGRLFNRVASFFVFLKANCTDGETYFPLVEPPASSVELEKWFGGKVSRGVVDGEEKGVVFRPITGNAVFWVNLGGDGVGDRRVVHAGLPVGEGEVSCCIGCFGSWVLILFAQKIGLNIWPRKFYGREDAEEVVERTRKGWSGKWKE